MALLLILSFPREGRKERRKLIVVFLHLDYDKLLQALLHISLMSTVKHTHEGSHFQGRKTKVQQREVTVAQARETEFLPKDKVQRQSTQAAQTKYH